MRILLAEDKRSLSRALTALLEKSNYSVDAAYDGEEALDMLAAENYDAVILDIMMPKTDGLTVLRTLRRRGSRVPVLLLTARAEVEDKVLGLDTGANDYLTKPFITDAGHEIKTPLTIMGADADLLELEYGQNEWLDDIQCQIRRLTGLTNDLIYLSRMDEERPQLQRIEFPLSDLAEEMVQSFQGPARAQQKQLCARIQPMLSFTGDEKALRQLVSILLDNAVKYSPAGGQIAVRLEKEGRSLKLAVTNDTLRPLEKDALNRMFDRFYRMDEARSSSAGGYGLGMSIARSIVQAHGGRIRAESPARNVLTVCVTLPL